MHRFFVSENLDGKDKLVLPEDIQHQIKNVLRLKTGEKIIFFDGSGYDFISELSEASGSKVKIVEKVLNRREPERKLVLFQSLLKKDKMEWVFQKGTEVGVSEFHPILSSRSVKKDFNKTRAEKIIKEAAEQSGRAVLPKINGTISFQDACDYVQKERFIGILADPNSKKHISEILKEPKMALFIGPEGGWTKEETDEARECGFQIVSLGRLNLRSETAAIVGSAFLVSGK